jgi:hypothetical protein
LPARSTDTTRSCVNKTAASSESEAASVGGLFYFGRRWHQESYP